MCHCNHQFSPDGTHQLCCREWAARGWTARHDRVVVAIAQEATRVGLPASSNNALLRLKFSHLNNGQHAECVVTGGDPLPVKDNVDRIRMRIRSTSLMSRSCVLSLQIISGN